MHSYYHDFFLYLIENENGWRSNYRHGDIEGFFKSRQWPHEVEARIQRNRVGELFSQLVSHYTRILNECMFGYKLRLDGRFFLAGNFKNMMILPSIGNAMMHYFADGKFDTQLDFANMGYPEVFNLFIRHLSREQGKPSRSDDRDLKSDGHDLFADMIREDIRAIINEAEKIGKPQHTRRDHQDDGEISSHSILTATSNVWSKLRLAQENWWG